MFNSPNHFGLITRALHLIMALLLILLLGLGLYVARMQVSLANLWLFDLHKGLGLIAFWAVVLRMIWHRISPVPHPKGHLIPEWQQRAARATHMTLYVLMIITPLSGWIGSAATGPDVTLFNWFTLPRIAPVSEPWEVTGFLIHSTAAYLMIVVICLHMGAALYHHFGLSDGSLRKMFLG